MRDYCWFSKSWEDTLYKPLSNVLRTHLIQVGANPLLLYVAPGPHAPALAKYLGPPLAGVILTDIDRAALRQAHRELSDTMGNASLQTVPLDFTFGVGRHCQRLSKVAKDPSPESILQLADTIWLDQAFDVLVNQSVNNLPTTLPPGSVNVAYSEMVATFTVTPALLSFRSRLYKLVSEGAISQELAFAILDAATTLWRKHNLAFYKFHLMMLARMVKPGGRIIIALDTLKVYDCDAPPASVESFEQRPDAIATGHLGISITSNEQFMWRDHRFGFQRIVHGMPVPDFKCHRHEVHVISYRKL